MKAAKILNRTFPTLALLGGLGALEYLRHRVQHHHLFLPDRYPNGIWDPSPFGLAVRDVWFEARDGVRLHGWWINHPRACGTVLYCHGNSGNISQRIGVLRHMRRLKVNILAFDYRGYGRSAGEPSEKGLCLDVRAAHACLTGELEQDPGTVILFGHSLGGAVAIDGALDLPVAGLVVQSSFTNTRDMARALYPQAPVYLVARNQFRSIDKVEHLGMPKLFIHGTADGTVPFALGRRLFERAAGPKDWYEVAKGDHNDVHRYGGFQYMWKLARFRNRCLAD